MALNIGTAGLDNLMLGSQQVDRVMLGTAEVWSSEKKWFWGTNEDIGEMQGQIYQYDFNLIQLFQKNDLSPAWRGQISCVGSGALYALYNYGTVPSGSANYYKFDMNTWANTAAINPVFYNNSSTQTQIFSAKNRMYWISNTSVISMNQRIGYSDLSTGAYLGYTDLVSQFIGMDNMDRYSLFGAGETAGGKITFIYDARYSDNTQTARFVAYDPDTNTLLSHANAAGVPNDHFVFRGCAVGKKTTLISIYNNSTDDLYSANLYDTTTGVLKSTPSNQAALRNATGGY